MKKSDPPGAGTYTGPAPSRHLSSEWYDRQSAHYTSRAEECRIRDLHEAAAVYRRIAGGMAYLAAMKRAEEAATEVGDALTKPG